MVSRKTHGDMLISSGEWERKVNTTMKCHYIPTRKAKVKKE
jgi:hypothetical protein